MFGLSWKIIALPVLAGRLAALAVLAASIGNLAVASASSSASASASRTASGPDTAKAQSQSPSADSIVIGRSAPNFTLRNQSGGQTQLQDFLGHWVVLYFYPKDFTGGCTVEAHNFQRDSAAYAKADAVILGVSVDNVKSHQGFCTQEKLNFKLLADTAGMVSKQYHSLRNVLGFKLAVRNTFIIDPQGKVARIFLGVKPQGHSEEVLAALAELRKR